MRLNKILLTFAFSFVLLVVSCSTSKRPKGNYCISKNIGPDYATIDFADKTFKAKSWSDVLGEFIVEGSWAKVGDTIFLDPFKLSVVDSVVKTSKAVGQNLIIKFIDKEKKKPLENVIIRDNEQEYVSNENGVLEMPQTKSSALYLTYYTISDTLDTSMLNGNVEIYLDFEKLKSIQLPDKWLLKGKRLIPVLKNYTSFKKC